MFYDFEVVYMQNETGGRGTTLGCLKGTLQSPPDEPPSGNHLQDITITVSASLNSYNYSALGGCRMKHLVDCEFEILKKSKRALHFNIWFMVSRHCSS